METYRRATLHNCGIIIPQCAVGHFKPERQKKKANFQQISKSVIKITKHRLMQKKTPKVRLVFAVFGRCFYGAANVSRIAKIKNAPNPPTGADAGGRTKRADF